MDGWLSWIRPPHHEFFKTACVLHDELYLLGGNEDDRKRADVRLYQDMVRHSLDYFKGAKVGRQAWFLALAYIKKKNEEQYLLLPALAWSNL